MVIQESSERILSIAQLQKNKLRNMKDQLEILLRKRIRLDSEIKVLKKSLTKRKKSFQLSLKTKISLEAFNPETLEPTEETVHFIEENLPECLPVLREYDQILREIEVLLEDLGD